MSIIIAFFASCSVFEILSHRMVCLKNGTTECPAGSQMYLSDLAKPHFAYQYTSAADDFSIYQSDAQAKTSEGYMCYIKCMMPGASGLPCSKGQLLYHAPYTRFPSYAQEELTGKSMNQLAKLYNITQKDIIELDCQTDAHPLVDAKYFLVSKDERNIAKQNQAAHIAQQEAIAAAAEPKQAHGSAQNNGTCQSSKCKDGACPNAEGICPEGGCAYGLCARYKLKGKCVDANYACSNICAFGECPNNSHVCKSSSRDTFAKK